MPFISRRLLVVLALLVTSESMLGALIPPFFLDCVVAIGVDTPLIVSGVPQMDNGVMKLQWQPLASGFLYGRPTGQKNDKGEALYTTFLVTNKHVVVGQSSLSLRFNPKGSKPAREYQLPLFDVNNKPVWFAPSDPQLDVVAIRVNMEILRNDGIQAEFFPSDKVVADTSKANQLGITEGDGVFVLGFPAQVVGGARSFVVVRQGAIARISDVLAGSGRTFIIDTFIFPGNSGGPVILKPEVTSIEGTKNQPQALLIGLVSSFLTYQETAISQQTGRPRIIFEENAGLANVISVDGIDAAIDEALKPQKPN